MPVTALPVGKACGSVAFQRRTLPLRASPANSCPTGDQRQQQDGQQPPAAAAPTQGGADAGRRFEFTYRGSDGRLKATFEQAFSNAGSSTGAVNGPDAAAAPWALGYQMAEKYALWDDELKARLLKRVAADELGVADEELEARLERVLLLLPDLRSKLASMRVQVLARLAADVDALPARLLRLKGIFPGCNASLLAMRQPELVLGFDLDRVEGAARELRALLPSLDIDRLVEENPAMLDVAGLRAAMAEAQRIMPQLDVQRAMATDPQLIFSFQTGNQLIPYDPPTPVADDDEYGQYYRT